MQFTNAGTLISQASNLTELRQTFMTLRPANRVSPFDSAEWQLPVVVDSLVRMAFRCGETHIGMYLDPNNMSSVVVRVNGRTGVIVSLKRQYLLDNFIASRAYGQELIDELTATADSYRNPWQIARRLHMLLIKSGHVRDPKRTTEEMLRVVAIQ